jgi:hypothetical protein
VIFIGNGDIATETVYASHLIVPEESFVEVTTRTEGSSVIGAIVDLKAFCIAAKPLLDDEDAMGGHKHKNSVMEVIEAFGVDNGAMDMVTEYANMIGDLKAAHPARPGLSGYLLDEMNDNILTGKSVVLTGLGEDQRGYKILDAEAFGFQYVPGYFKKLRVRISDFGAAHSKLHAGKGGKAIAAWSKSGKADEYDKALARITAKYMALQHKEDELQEQGGKIAIRASFKENSDENGEKKTVETNRMGPLPVAGAEGATTVRHDRDFKMPSVKAIHTEALEETKKFMAKLAGENMSLDEIIESIETTLEGTSVRVTTGSRWMSESAMKPTIKIVGTAGTTEGTLDALPMVGHTLTQVFPSKVDGGNIGNVKRVVLTAPDGDTNPWLCTGIEVQVGHGKPWVPFYPHGGKKQYADGFWLDGSDGKAGPYYRLGRQAEWLLLTDATELEYAKLHAGKMPRCVDMKDGCFKETDGESVKSMGDKCDAEKKCQGFTYTPKKIEGGAGCLQYRCHSTDVDTDTESETVEGVDYYTKQAFEWISKDDELPTDCPTACGFKGRKWVADVDCSKVRDGSKVDDENCDAWKPPLPKPKPGEKECPATPKCTPAPTPTPTAVPTPVPTPQPTPFPTQHPCISGNHGCDKGKGGICIQDGANEYKCSCAPQYQCTEGCDDDHHGHTCVLTPSPTPNPTPVPTPTPTAWPQVDEKPIVFKKDDTSPVPKGGVTFYKHCMSDGRSAEGYRVTIFNNKADVSKVGMRNNDVSGIMIPHGWQVEIFDHKNFAGTMQKYDACDTEQTRVPCLVKQGFNDKMESTKISPCPGHTYVKPTPEPTAAPTPVPTPVPTPFPTHHPCISGSHNCDKGEGGICIQDGENYKCGCAPQYKCTNGCDFDHSGHQCTRTPSPTPVPTTAMPTPTPTPDPTVAPTATPTRPAKVYGNCECSVGVYRSANYKGGRCSYQTTRLGMADTHLQWRPPKGCRGDMNSISISSGCAKVNIIDDDDGSWGKHRQDKVIKSSISDLPYDLEDDVWGLDMYPKKTCCVKNC